MPDSEKDPENCGNSEFSIFLTLSHIFENVGIILDIS